MFRLLVPFYRLPTNLHRYRRRHLEGLLLSAPDQALLLRFPQELSFFFLTILPFGFFLQFASLFVSLTA